MRSTHRVVAGAVTAGVIVAAAPAAVAQTPMTLTLDRPCYSPGDTLTATGGGFSPNGPVSISLSGAGVGMSRAQADAAGSFRFQEAIEQDDIEGLVGNDRVQRQVLITAVDDQRAAAGAEPPGVAAQFMLSQFGVVFRQNPDRLSARRKLQLAVFGFTGSAGRRAYLHYVRGGRRLVTVPLGVLRGDCGDLVRTLPRAVPARIARRGRFELRITLSPTDSAAPPRVRGIVRVTRL